MPEHIPQHKPSPVLQCPCLKGMPVWTVQSWSFQAGLNSIHRAENTMCFRETQCFRIISLKTQCFHRGTTNLQAFEICLIQGSLCYGCDSCSMTRSPSEFSEFSLAEASAQFRVTELMPKLMPMSRPTDCAWHACEAQPSAEAETPAILDRVKTKMSSNERGGLLNTEHVVCCMQSGVVWNCQDPNWFPKLTQQMTKGSTWRGPLSHAVCATCPCLETTPSKFPEAHAWPCLFLRVPLFPVVLHRFFPCFRLLPFFLGGVP